MRESRKPNDIDAILSRHGTAEVDAFGVTHQRCDRCLQWLPCDALAAATEARRLREALQAAEQDADRLAAVVLEDCRLYHDRTKRDTIGWDQRERAWDAWEEHDRRVRGAQP